MKGGSINYHKNSDSKELLVSNYLLSLPLLPYGYIHRYEIKFGVNIPNVLKLLCIEYYTQPYEIKIKMLNSTVKSISLYVPSELASITLAIMTQILDSDVFYKKNKDTEVIEIILFPGDGFVTLFDNNDKTLFGDYYFLSSTSNVKFISENSHLLMELFRYAGIQNYDHPKEVINVYTNREYDNIPPEIGYLIYEENVK